MSELLEIRGELTEEQLREMAKNKGLTREEWECLRKNYGLPHDEALVFGLDAAHFIARAFWKMGRATRY